MFTGQQLNYTKINKQKISTNTLYKIKLSVKQSHKTQH